MTGRQLIDFINKNGLENEEIEIELGSTEFGELHFVKIKELKIYNEYYYRNVIVPENHNVPTMK